MTTFSIVGCSISKGVGLSEEKESPDNYANIIANTFNAKINNQSIGGLGNYDIFVIALSELASGADHVFVQWSGLDRLPIFRPYFNYRIALNYKDNTDKKLQQFLKVWSEFYTDYANVINLLEYSLILQKLSQGRVTFINGLVDWSEDLFKEKINDLSLRSQEIVNVRNNSDLIINKALTELRDQFVLLDKKLWYNMFDSLYHQIVDYGSDGQHPGKISHQTYASGIIEYLKNERKF